MVGPLNPKLSPLNFHPSTPSQGVNAARGTCGNLIWKQVFFWKEKYLSWKEKYLSPDYIFLEKDWQGKLLLKVTSIINL
jgi:hypothetical protein